MASSAVMASIITMLLGLLAMAADGFEDLAPLYSPYLDTLCDEVECGKGSCKAGLEYPFNFICECDPGWKRTRLDNEEDLQYLPCVIPNCTLDYSCMAAPPPIPPVQHNATIFDPCYWIYCGEGTCTKETTYAHKCECKEGYSNLLNISAYPCFSDCTIGNDCSKLGIRVANLSSTPSLNEVNQGGSFSGKLHWIGLSILSMAMVLWE